jgi:hypothetical protein
MLSAPGGPEHRHYLRDYDIVREIVAQAHSTLRKLAQ